MSCYSGGGSCCPSGSTCQGNRCLAAGTTLCGNSNVCTSTQTCQGNAVCCDQGATFCNNGCCAQGNVCINNQCVATGSSACGPTVICTVGQFCGKELCSYGSLWLLCWPYLISLCTPAVHLQLQPGSTCCKQEYVLYSCRLVTIHTSQLSVELDNSFQQLTFWLLWGLTTHCRQPQHWHMLSDSYPDRLLHNLLPVASAILQSNHTAVCQQSQQCLCTWYNLVSFSKHLLPCWPAVLPGTVCGQQCSTSRRCYHPLHTCIWQKARQIMMRVRSRRLAGNGLTGHGEMVLMWNALGCRPSLCHVSDECQQH